MDKIIAHCDEIIAEYMEIKKFLIDDCKSKTIGKSEIDEIIAQCVKICGKNDEIIAQCIEIKKSPICENYHPYSEILAYLNETPYWCPDVNDIDEIGGKNDDIIAQYVEIKKSPISGEDEKNIIKNIASAMRREKIEEFSIDDKIKEKVIKWCVSNEDEVKKILSSFGYTHEFSTNYHPYDEILAYLNGTPYWCPDVNEINDNASGSMRYYKNLLTSSIIEMKIFINGQYYDISFDSKIGKMAFLNNNYWSWHKGKYNSYDENHVHAKYLFTHSKKL